MRKFNAAVSVEWSTIGLGAAIHYCGECAYVQVDVLCFSVTVGWFDTVTSADIL